jgi:hypothetical protein
MRNRHINEEKAAKKGNKRATNIKGAAGTHDGDDEDDNIDMPGS